MEKRRTELLLLLLPFSLRRLFASSLAFSLGKVAAPRLATTLFSPLVVRGLSRSRRRVSRVLSVPLLRPRLHLHAINPLPSCELPTLPPPPTISRSRPRTQPTFVSFSSFQLLPFFPVLSFLLPPSLSLSPCLRERELSLEVSLTRTRATRSLLFWLRIGEIKSGEKWVCQPRRKEEEEEEERRRRRRWRWWSR